jgi:UDPglucose 6-dehydrogenase
VIGFAGLSHLGVVSSAAAAAKGFDVAGYDPDATLGAALADAKPTVNEPGLPELLVEVSSRIRYSADPAVLSQCDVIYISVDVPTDADNRSDSAPVERLLRDAARAAQPGATLVVLSQVRPGFSRGLQTEIESASGKRLRLYYQVETLVFGVAVERALKPERFIVGCADPTQPLPAAFRSFLEAFGCPVLPMRYESAELCKISINMFLVSSVTTSNVLAQVCEAVGADWREIAPALRLDRRIGQYAYLTPGLGIGGGNLTRDLATVAVLAAEYGTDAQVVATWVADSNYRRDWVLRLLHRKVLSARPDPIVAVWGLAYKENTQSVKNSPGMHLLRTLAASGIRTRAYDPEVAVPADDASRLGVVPSALDACDGADVVVVMTPWPEFGRVDLPAAKGRMRSNYLIDPFGRIDGDRAAAAGLTYARLGLSPAYRG